MTPQCAPPPAAEQDFIRRALQPLVLVFGVPESASAPGFWQVYFEALAGFSREAVLEAVRAYPKDESAAFFPKPGKLRALVAEQAERIELRQRLAQRRIEAPSRNIAAVTRTMVHACRRCRMTTTTDHWRQCTDLECPLHKAGAAMAFVI